jgi:hypothetical protein
MTVASEPRSSAVGCRVYTNMLGELGALEQAGRGARVQEHADHREPPQLARPRVVHQADVTTVAPLSELVAAQLSRAPHT